MLKEYVALAGVQCQCVPLLACPRFASTLETYGSLSTGDRKQVASIASPILHSSLRTRTSDDNSVCVATLMLTLVLRAKAPHWKLSKQLACCMVLF